MENEKKQKSKLKERTHAILTITIVSGLFLFGLCSGIYGVLGIVGNKAVEFKIATVDYIMGGVSNYSWTVNVPKAKAVGPEPTIREYIKNEVEKAGLKWSEVDCLIQNESGWNNWAYNINSNGTTDFGLWQINSLHKKTASVDCRWDYKCSTKWAIKKRLNDGNWSAWYGFKKCKKLKLKELSLKWENLGIQLIENKEELSK